MSDLGFLQVACQGRICLGCPHRRLKNVMERAAFVRGGELLSPDDFVLQAQPFPLFGSDERVDALADRGATRPTPFRSPGLGERAPTVPSLEISRTVALAPAEDERQRVLTALASCGENQTRAAKLLGFSRRTLVNRLRDYNLPRPKKPL